MAEQYVLVGGELCELQYTRDRRPVGVAAGLGSGVSTRATAPVEQERVPEPQRIDAVASVNFTDRAISVRVSDLASGYAKLAWRQAFRALKSAEEAGWSNHSTVWASTPTKFQAAYAVPGDADFGGVLKFAFAKGETAFWELVSKPVTATVFVDRSTGWFINVNLKNSR